MKALLLTLSLFASLTAAQTDPPAAISIRHVTVVNVVTGEELPDQTVRIEGNRIASIVSTQDSDAALKDGVDAHGGFLIPGLWDMHVHVHDTNELALYIANGVTGVRVMSGDRDTSAFRAELARQQPSPAIYLGSAIVDGDPPVWRQSIVVKNEKDARRAVGEIKASGADFIKVYNRIPRSGYFALAEEAKQQHIPFEGHVPDSITAQEASDAGQRSMEHLQGIAPACSAKQNSLMGSMNRVQFFRDRLELEADGYRTLDQAKCQALFAEFRRNDTWQVPTLTVRRVWGRLNDSKFTSDSRLAYVGRRSRGRWEERTQSQMRMWGPAMYQMAHGIFSVEEHIVGAMFKAGVPMIAGTDAMNPYCFPGFSLHDELAMMVESGLTPLGALQTATINPAKFLGRTEDLGTVEKGKIADLVLLGGDPLQDIHNTTRIQAVWHEGKYFDEAAITQLFEAVKKSAKR